MGELKQYFRREDTADAPNSRSPCRELERGGAEGRLPRHRFNTRNRRIRQPGGPPSLEIASLQAQGPREPPTTTPQRQAYCEPAGPDATLGELEPSCSCKNSTPPPVLRVSYAVGRLPRSANHAPPPRWQSHPAEERLAEAIVGAWITGYLKGSTTNTPSSPGLVLGSRHC